MILLFIILIITVILYLARKFGYMDIVQCVLLAIIAFGIYCPDPLKHFLFFQLNLNEILVGVPVDIMSSEKIKALANVNNQSVGEILSNLTNNLIDILSQKPVDNSAHLENQTKLLSSIDQKLSDANTIAEVSLEQYAKGQNIALNKLSSINNALDVQTKELKVVINNPVGVIDSLNNINYNVKPTIKMLGELNEINFKLGQEKQILSEGFNKLLQSDGNVSLSKELQNLSSSLDKKLAMHQDNISQTLQSMTEQVNLERSENKKLLEQMQVSSLAEIELAYEEAEKKIQVAENMANYYRKHEALGQANSSSGINASKIDTNSVNQAAAGIGLASALTWVLKFLRIV